MTTRPLVLSDRFETFLTFDTPLPCLVCGTPTQWGHIWQYHDTCTPVVMFMLEAYCPQHGFPERREQLGEGEDETLQEQQEQAESVARFVVAMHNGQGQATVLAPVRPALAPSFQTWQAAETYESDEDEEEGEDKEEEVWHNRAWSVRYEAHPEANPVYFIVVYDDEHFQFHLCAEDGSCRPPQHSA